MDERNPHYVTPEEAEEKICINSHYCCVGTNCMAWRWHEYQVPIPENERTGPNFWKREISKTYGRCGMVPL